MEEAPHGGKKSKSAAGAPMEEEAPAKPQRSTGRRQKSAEEPEVRSSNVHTLARFCVLFVDMPIALPSPGRCPDGGGGGGSPGRQ